MSVVTNVILSFSASEIDLDDDYLDVIARVNKFFPVGAGFKRSVDETAGGTKHMERPTFCGAFNYLDLEGFSKHLSNLPWKYPENVQLFVCEQDDEVYRQVELFQ